MSIIYNGVTLTDIIYNGVSLDKVIYNGVTVFEKVSIREPESGDYFSTSPKYYIYNSTALNLTRFYWNNVQIYFNNTTGGNIYSFNDGIWTYYAGSVISSAQTAIYRIKN